jgi:DNA-directed RNA polymerase specialized sigma24 family protein
MTTPAKEKLYKRYKGGASDALFELLEGERTELYDFLMRMTGEVTRSMETIDEVYAALSEETLAPIDSAAELRVCLYTTARKFNADIWNANTARLVNAALEPPPDHAPKSDDRAQRERAAFNLLDKALRSLPGPEREAVCLKTRAGFSAAEIGEIMSLEAAEANNRLGTGLKRIDADCAAGGANASLALDRLPPHPAPLRSSQRTMNLSVVMQGIKARPVGLWSPLRIILLLLLAAALVAYFVAPEQVVQLFDLLKPKIGSAPPD